MGKPETYTFAVWTLQKCEDPFKIIPQWYKKLLGNEYEALNIQLMIFK